MSKYIALLFILVFTTIEINATVIGTSHISGGNTIFVDQEFIASDPSGGRDFTGFSFTPNFDEFEFQGSFIDEGVSVFLVEENDVFSEFNILGGDFTELTFGAQITLDPGFSVGMITVEPTLFLGVRTPALGVNFGSFEPAYGWIEVQNLAGNLQVVDHAIAFGAEGIIVNTLIAVPEPSGVLLIAIGFVGISTLRRRPY